MYKPTPVCLYTKEIVLLFYCLWKSSSAISSFMYDLKLIIDGIATNPVQNCSKSQDV